MRAAIPPASGDVTVSANGRSCGEHFFVHERLTAAQLRLERAYDDWSSSLILCHNHNAAEQTTAKS